MRQKSRLWAVPLAALLFALVTVAAAGCGSSSGTSSSSTSSATIPTNKVDPKVAALVPSKYKNGSLTVGTDPTYPPMESFASDGTTIVGADPDIGKALGEVMGVPFNFVNANFDSILPGLNSGKYDLGMSAFTDTKDRQKVVDFVTYLTAGTGFYTKASGGTSVNGLSDLCGHSVAAEKGTTQQIDATAQDQKCKAAGKPGVNVTVFPDQNGANLAVSSGRAEIGMADSPVAEYIVEQSNGQFKVTGNVYNTAPYGIAMPKGSGLTKPIQAALKAIIANGTYKKILQKYGIEKGALDNPTINGAIS